MLTTVYSRFKLGTWSPITNLPCLLSYRNVTSSSFIPFLRFCGRGRALRFDAIHVLAIRPTNYPVTLRLRMCVTSFICGLLRCSAKQMDWNGIVTNKTASLNFQGRSIAHRWCVTNNKASLNFQGRFIAQRWCIAITEAIQKCKVRKALFQFQCFNTFETSMRLVSYVFNRNGTVTIQEVKDSSLYMIFIVLLMRHRGQQVTRVSEVILTGNLYRRF